MASTPLSTARADCSEPAIFTLLKPIKLALKGEDVDVHGVEMRTLVTADLALLDQFQGQPVALAQNVIAALCGITVEQVCQLETEDFTMLASDALWQIEQVGISMGLPERFFLAPRAVGDDD